MKTEINMYLENNDNGEVSPPILWDACKAVMRGKIIATTSLLKKIRQERLNKLQQHLEELQRQHMRNLDSKVKKEIKKTQEEINDLYMQETQKKFIFTKQKYYEVGGKSTKLLAYRLCKKQADNLIYKIRNPITKKFEYGSD